MGVGDRLRIGDKDKEGRGSKESKGVPGAGQRRDLHRVSKHGLTTGLLGAGTLFCSFWEVGVLRWGPPDSER